jgi:hypothetical protein
MDHEEESFFFFLTGCPSINVSHPLNATLTAIATPIDRILRVNFILEVSVIASSCVDINV